MMCRADCFWKGYRNIGVFFWATGAVIDGDIPRDVRPVVELDTA